MYAWLFQEEMSSNIWHETSLKVSPNEEEERPWEEVLCRASLSIALCRDAKFLKLYMGQN